MGSWSRTGELFNFRIRQLSIAGAGVTIVVKQKSVIVISFVTSNVFPKNCVLSKLTMEHIDSVQTIQNLYHVASTAPANTMPGSLGGLLDRHLNMARVSLGDVQNEQKQVSENICFWLGKVQLEVLNPGERATYSVQSFFRAGRCLRARRAPLRR